MNYDTIIVGDFVRSFDYDNRRDCYTEGVVEDVVERDGAPRYKIKVSRSVFCDKEEKSPVVGKYVYPLVNGTPTFGHRVAIGVELIRG